MPLENEVSHLIRMPDVVFEHILSYLTYDAIAKTRIVCRHFNNVCQGLLNRGFYSAVQFHAKCSKEVKSQLPRRESKRPNHPLARHNNILHAIETRLSLLKMTYCKYIHYNACCFIPGKVVDELFKVLHLVNNTKGNLIPHEVLTELRDISSMAMDYFEEKIVPSLRSPNSSSPPQPSPSSSALSVLSSSFSPKAAGLSPSSHSTGAAYGALNASMQATLSSLSHCFGEVAGGGSMIGGSGSSAFFPYSDDLLDGEMKNAIDSLVPQHQAPRSSLNTPTQLVPVPTETLKALIQALRETLGRKSKAERQLTMMQTKLLEVSRKVQDQERTISEQSRLLAEHSVRFSQHSRSIFEIVNNSVMAEVVDMEDGNTSLLSIPDYESDTAEYGDLEPGTDDHGTFGYQDDGDADCSVSEDAQSNDGLRSSRDDAIRQSAKGSEIGGLSVEIKEPSFREKQTTSTLDRQSGEIDMNILETNIGRKNVCDSLSVKEKKLSLADRVLRTPSATEPMALTRVLKNLPETESPVSNDLFSCNLSSFNATPSSLKSTFRGNIYSESQPSTSRHAIRRIGRPPKASAAASSNTRACLPSKSLTTLLSSLADSEAALPSSRSSSHGSTLTKGLHHPRLSLHLKRLQSSPRASPTFRKTARRRSISRSPSSGGPLGQLSRSRSLSAIRHPLLKTPDGRIIVIRQRPTGGCPSSGGSASDISRNDAEFSEPGASPSIHNPQLKGDASDCSSNDHLSASGDSGEMPDLLGPSSSAGRKQLADSSITQQQKTFLQNLHGFTNDDDSDDTCEKAGKNVLQTIPRVTGGQNRKRKLSIVMPPADGRGVGYQKDEVKDHSPDKTPGSDECSRKARLDSSVSLGAATSKSGLAALTSDEESDDQIPSQNFKKTRVELLDDLKTNYAE